MVGVKKCVQLKLKLLSLSNWIQLKHLWATQVTSNFMHWLIVITFKDYVIFVTQQMFQSNWENSSISEWYIYESVISCINTTRTSFTAFTTASTQQRNVWVKTKFFVEWGMTFAKIDWLLYLSR